MFNDVIKGGRNENGLLVKDLLDISIMTTKLNLLKSDKKVHDEMLQVLDIMAAIINNFPDRPGKGNSKPPSELTCYRRFAQILDVMVRDTSLELDDGEQVCKASKKIATENKRFGSGKQMPFSRKIDLIISDQAFQLASQRVEKERRFPNGCGKTAIKEYTNEQSNSY